jgi:hypothetical protein
LRNDDDDGCYSYDPNSGTQEHDGMGVANSSAEDDHETNGIEDGSKSRDSEHQCSELSSTLSAWSAWSPIVAIEQPTAEANGHAVSDGQVPLY